MEDAGGFSSAIRELDGKEVFEDGKVAKDDTASDLTTGRIAVLLIIENVSKELARLVCDDPGRLQYLEWRDLERMLATVLDGIGYA